MGPGEPGKKSAKGLSISGMRRVVMLNATETAGQEPLQSEKTDKEHAMKTKRFGVVSWMGAAVAAMVWLSLGATAALAAGKQDNGSSAAFAKIKSLAGNWEAETEKGKVTGSYEVVSNGSAVLEKINVPGESEMVTVYHLDGSRLVLTHYCTAGNQPRMQAEAYDPDSNQLVFKFAGGDNLSDPNTGHMHNAVLKFSGPDAFTAAWTFHKDGKAAFTENIHYHRVK
jgi:hypothetical protein